MWKKNKDRETLSPAYKHKPNVLLKRKNKLQDKEKKKKRKVSTYNIIHKLAGFPRFGYQIRLRTTGGGGTWGTNGEKKFVYRIEIKWVVYFIRVDVKRKKWNVTQYDNICILICVVNNPRRNYAKTHEWKVECFLCIRMLSVHAPAVCNLLRVFKRFCNVNILHGQF